MLNDISNLPCNYIATSCGKFIYFLSEEKIAWVIEIPSLVTSICTGNFVSESKFADQFTVINNKQSGHELAISCDTGVIYILSNFELVEYASCDFHITKLARFADKSATKNTDILVCAGHFCSLLMYKNGTLVHQFETSDWIHDISVQNSLVLMGLMDDTILLVDFEDIENIQNDEDLMINE